MIVSEFDGAEGRIVLRPNRSWTWRANAYLVGTLMAVSGSMATLFAYQGMWLILPFTVIEMSVLLACLYYCVRRTHLQEVLTFSPEYLVLERGVGRPERRDRFQRYFTRFFVRRPPHPWYRKRIALKCRDLELEIGSFLNNDEKDDLVVALRDMIARLDQRSAGGEARQ
ncbi:MAG: DUF2244 domain-containing protein [Pseudomonadales bacterium]